METMLHESSQPPVSSATLLLIGPILIGALLSFMLFGISIVQLYVYHVSFPADKFPLRLSVYTVFVLDVFQSTLAAGMAWDTLCAGWGRPMHLIFPAWPFYPLPIVSGVVSAWVQIFYAWRIHRVWKWRVVPGIIVIFSLAQTGAAFAIAISFAILRDIKRLHDTSMFARTIVWLCGGAVTDMTIMISMVYLLYSYKRNMNPFHRSDLVIDRVLRLTVETGCACAIAATLELVLFLLMPDTNMHFIIALILSKVYSNTLMASLNARARPSVPDSSTILFNHLPSIALETVSQQPLSALHKARSTRRSKGDEVGTDHLLQPRDIELESGNKTEGGSDEIALAGTTVSA